LIRNLITIGAGGFLGAVLRYLAVLFAQLFKGKTSIPLGTLLIGVLATLGARSKILTDEGRNFLIVGVLGAFTTFSTFGYESVSMLQGGLRLGFMMNIALQLGLGFTAVWAGMHLGRLILGQA